MVRLISRENVRKLEVFIKGYFGIQKYLTNILQVNKPEVPSCVYAMWHAHQFGIYGFDNRGKVNVMVSNSSDGDLVAAGVEMLGFKTVRGSTGRQGNIAATKQMIERLQAGERAAIMVDGPRGPARKVKGGIVRIAQNAGVPIVPVVWYCPQFNFVTLPSWDKMSAPIGYCKIINVYGEPIFVDSNKDENEVMEEIRISLENLEKKAPEIYKEAKKNKLWKRPFQYMDSN